jgi:hypothetical protein
MKFLNLVELVWIDLKKSIRYRTLQLYHPDSHTYRIEQLVAEEQNKRLWDDPLDSRVDAAYWAGIDMGKQYPTLKSQRDLKAYPNWGPNRQES